MYLVAWVYVYTYTLHNPIFTKVFSHKYNLTVKEVVADCNLNIWIHSDITGKTWFGMFIMYLIIMVSGHN